MSKKYLKYSNMVSSIQKLYKSKKYKDVVELSTEFLKFYENDVFIRDLRANSYRFLGYTDLAIKDLEKNMTIRSNDDTIVCLFYTYFQKGDYEKAIKLLPDMYNIKKYEIERLNTLEYYMKKQLSMKCNVMVDKKKYIIKQIDNYDELLAKIMLSNFKCAGANYISKDISITYLFKILKRNINSINKSLINEMFEVHYYYIKNIGYHKGEYYNYLKVVVLPNTTNILLAYPVREIKHGKIEYMNYSYNKLFKIAEKDVDNSEMAKRFYKRYNTLNNKN